MNPVNDPSSSSAQSTIDYTIGPEELRVIGLCTGYLTKWKAEDLSGDSMGKTYTSILVADVSPRVASWALLAAMDDLRLRSASDPTLVPVLCAVARTPYLAMATATLNTDPHPLTDEVHRVNVDRDSFNSRVNLSSYERETPLGQASVWTLVKVVSAQWRAGVNRCYRPGQRDLPVISAPPVSKGDNPKSKPKTKAKTNENYDGEHAKPMSRCPEDSAWRNRASMGLVRILYDIKDLYNHILMSDPDLSQAYAEQGRLRREQRDAEYAKRQEARQTQVKVQAKTQVRVQAKTQVRVQAKTRTDTKPRVEAVPEVNPVPEVKVVPEVKAETEGFVTVVRKTQSKDKPKPKTKTWDKRISH